MDGNAAGSAPAQPPYLTSSQRTKVLSISEVCCVRPQQSQRRTEVVVVKEEGDSFCSVNVGWADWFPLTPR